MTDYMNEEKIYTQADLNDAVTKAISDMSKVLEEKERLIAGLRVTYQASTLEKVRQLPTVCGNNPKWCENCVSKGKCASTKPQGEWNFNGFTYSCSFCGKSPKTIGYCGSTAFMTDNFKFCPNCGADMREADK